MLTQSNTQPTTAFEIEMRTDGQCDILFYENVKEIEKEEQLNYEYDFYRLPAVYRKTLTESVEENYDAWLEMAKRHEFEFVEPLTLDEKVMELQYQQEVQDTDIALNQDAINFMLFAPNAMTASEDEDNKKTKGVNTMAAYLANQILKGKLDYELVMSRYATYKEDIDTILIGEGKQDLIK